MLFPIPTPVNYPYAETYECGNPFWLGYASEKNFNIINIVPIMIHVLYTFLILFLIQADPSLIGNMTEREAINKQRVI